jgi:hypothetical protein
VLTVLAFLVIVAVALYVALQWELFRALNGFN